jgi:hypothetical protein
VSSLRSLTRNCGLRRAFAQGHLVRVVLALLIAFVTAGPLSLSSMFASVVEAGPADRDPGDGAATGKRAANEMDKVDRRRRWKELPRRDRKALRHFYSQLSDEARKRFLHRYESLDSEERARVLRRVRQVLGKLSPEERRRILDSSRPREQRLGELHDAVDEGKHRIIEERRRFLNTRLQELPPRLQDRIRDWPLRRQAGFVQRYIANQLLTKSFPNETARQRFIELPHAIWRQVREQPDQRPADFPEDLWTRWTELEPQARRTLARHAHHVRRKARHERARQMFRQVVPDETDRQVLMRLTAQQVRELKDGPEGERPGFLAQPLWQRWSELDQKQRSTVLRLLHRRCHRNHGGHWKDGPRRGGHPGGERWRGERREGRKRPRPE